MTGLESWQTLGRAALVVRLAGLGAVAGLAAWVLVFVLALLFDLGRPGASALVLAVPRGAIFGVVLALILSLFWSRSRRETDSESTARDESNSA